MARLRLTLKNAIRICGAILCFAAFVECVLEAYGNPDYINEPEAGTLAAPNSDARQADSQNSLSPFIGIALSGGGSRAANFGAATLLELDKLGLIEHVSAISSVSGGSIPAGYFALFHHDPLRWNSVVVREKMAIPIEFFILLNIYNPLKVGRYWFGSYSRTDMLTQALNEKIFDFKRYRDVDPQLRDALLINATDAGAASDRFTFTKETMRAFGSSLDSFYIARAVTASGAFPGGFSAVPIRDYEQKGEFYRHYFDGGVHDNLGIEALADAYAAVAHADMDRGERPRDCLFFIVDSEVHGKDPRRSSVPNTLRDTRHGLDYLVDTNAFTVLDVAYGATQADLRSRYSPDLVGDRAADSPLPNISIYSKRSNGSAPEILTKCPAWHIGLARATKLILESGTRDARRVTKHGWPIVDTVSTRYNLIAQERLSPTEIQNALFDAANTLVLNDPLRPLATVCAWFDRNGLSHSRCGTVSEDKAR
jgi:predicted acylesterase/phospholipase RssA